MHIPTPRTGEDRGKKGRWALHPGTGANLPSLATTHMGPGGQSCPTGPGSTPNPLCLMNTPVGESDGGAGAAGRAQLWTRQKDGQGAKAYPRKSVWGLFSLAGGGYRGFHSPWRQSQDRERA